MKTAQNALSEEQTGFQKIHVAIKNGVLNSKRDFFGIYGTTIEEVVASAAFEKELRNVFEKAGVDDAALTAIMKDFKGSYSGLYGVVDALKGYNITMPDIRWAVYDAARAIEQMRSARDRQVAEMKSQMQTADEWRKSDLHLGIAFQYALTEDLYPRHITSLPDPMTMEAFTKVTASSLKTYLKGVESWFLDENTSWWDHFKKKYAENLEKGFGKIFEAADSVENTGGDVRKSLVMIVESLNELKEKDGLSSENQIVLKNFLRVINELATTQEFNEGDMIAYVGVNELYRGRSFVVQAEKRRDYGEEKLSGTVPVKQATGSSWDTYVSEYPSALFDPIAKATEDVEGIRKKRLEKLSEEGLKFSKAIAGFASRMLSMDPGASIREEALDRYIEFARYIIGIGNQASKPIEPRQEHFVDGLFDFVEDGFSVYMNKKLALLNCFTEDGQKAVQSAIEGPSAESFEMSNVLLNGLRQYRSKLKESTSMRTALDPTDLVIIKTPFFEDVAVGDVLNYYGDPTALVSEKTMERSRTMRVSIRGGDIMTVAELLGVSDRIEGGAEQNRILIDEAIRNRDRASIWESLLETSALSEISEAKLSLTYTGVIVDTIDEVEQVLRMIYLSDDVTDRKVRSSGTERLIESVRQALMDGERFNVHYDYTGAPNDRMDKGGISIEMENGKYVVYCDSELNSANKVQIGDNDSRVRLDVGAAYLLNKPSRLSRIHPSLTFSPVSNENGQRAYVMDLAKVFEGADIPDSIIQEMTTKFGTSIDRSGYGFFKVGNVKCYIEYRLSKADVTLKDGKLYAKTSEKGPLHMGLMIRTETGTEAEKKDFANNLTTALGARESGEELGE